MLEYALKVLCIIPTFLILHFEIWILYHFSDWNQIGLTGLVVIMYCSLLYLVLDKECTKI
jgi:hypothetical protein